GGARLLPAHRERRQDLQLLAAFHEALVDLAVDRVGEQLVLGHRVRGEVVALARPAERLGVGEPGQGGAGECGEDNEARCSHRDGLLDREGPIIATIGALRLPCAMSEPIARVEGLRFEYPGVRALDDVSFTLAPGTVTALVGPNGAGKSTLLRCM